MMKGEGLYLRDCKEESGWIGLDAAHISIRTLETEIKGVFPGIM